MGVNSSTSIDNRSASVRAVAMAGRGRTTGLEDEAAGAAMPVSSWSDDENEYFRDEARDRPGTPLTPPRPLRSSVASHSPSRDSKFVEMV